MQVQFNRPVTLGKNTYGKGQHAVPDEDVKDNWFFDALVKKAMPSCCAKTKLQKRPLRPLLKLRLKLLRKPKLRLKLLLPRPPARRASDGHRTVSHRFSGVRGQCPLP